MNAKRVGGAIGFSISNSLFVTAFPRAIIAVIAMTCSTRAQSGLLREVYTNIWGIEVANLTNAAKFPDQPDLVNAVPAFETPSMFADNYGERLRGFLMPPMTGVYTFYVCSDDQGILFLSPTTNAADKKVIAYEATWSPPRSWTGIVAGRTNAGNISAPILLQGGRAYYVEALHKEGGGGDNFAVAWRLPGGPVPVDGSEPISGEFLSIECPPQTNHAPAVAIFTPTEGATFLPGTNILLRAEAFDAEDRPLEVAFFEGANFIGKGVPALSSDPNAYVLMWTNVLAGTYTLTAQATDRDGLSATSAPVHISVSAQPRFVVTSAADSGPGSLRDLVASAPPGVTITFAITGSIELTSGSVLMDKPLVLQGPGAQVLTVRRSAAAETPDFRIFNVNSPGVVISGLTISGGRIGSGSDYQDGAGIENRGDLLLTQCVIRDNQALGEYSRGGGICTHSDARLTIDACTFAGNSASGYYGEGGAVYNYGYLAATNSTFSGNSAGGWGGAVHNDMLSQGTFLDSCTFTLNRAGFGGGIFNRGAPPSNVSAVYLRNTLVVGNDGYDIGHCSLILSGGYNLIGTMADPYGGSLALPFALGPGDQTNVTAAQVRLGPLQMNGGTTPTHAPLAHSLAIDSGPGETFPAFDQRGIPRPFGVRADVGAVESNILFSNTPPSVLCPDSAVWRATSTAGATGTLTVWVRDLDGDELLVTWMLDGVPASTNRVPGSLPETSVNVSWTVTLTPGAHTVQVAVSDGQAAPASCSTVVTVLPGLEPPLVVNRTISGNSIALHAKPGSAINVYAVEDHPPAGWEIINISDGGVFDRVTGKVKFGPYFDHQERTLHYMAMPPLGFVGIGRFVGFGSADGAIIQITGDDTLLIAPPHPADVRPENWVLRIDEVTAYAAAWRTGGVWALPPNPIPIDYVTRAAALWQGGEAYVLDPNAGGPPLWWVNAPLPPINVKQELQDWVSAVRRLPAGYLIGEAVDVAIEVVPGADVGCYALEEILPPGWQVADSGADAALDAANRRLKWGPFFDALPRTLRYSLLPANGKGTAKFIGNTSADGRLTVVAGASELGPAARLVWAADRALGHQTLRLSGVPGCTYLIETSGDLLSWTELMVVTNVSGSVEIPGPPGQNGQRFYRARTLE